MYEKVFAEKRKRMQTNLHASGQYYQYFLDFDFWKIHKEFVLIENNDSQQLFIPILIPIIYFENKQLLQQMDVLSEDKEFVDGEKVFRAYMSIIKAEYDDFVLKQIDLKQIGSLMSQFSISIYRKQLDSISSMLDPEKSKFGFQYLLNHDLCYTPECGFDSNNIDTSNFL